MTTTSGFTNEEIVDAFYLAFFGRAADTGGRAYWLKELAASDVNKLAASMLSTMDHPPAGPFNALVMIYQGLFGKAVDVGADEYWLPVLEGKGTGEAVLEILKVGMATDPSTPGNPTVNHRLAVKDHQLQAQQTQDMSLSVDEARAVMSQVHDNSATRDSAVAAIDQQTGLRVQGDAVGVTLLAGATVFADGNGNGRLDEGEAHALTDAKGHYVLDRAHGPLHTVGAGGEQGTALDHLRADPHSGDINAFTTLAQTLAAADPRYADPRYADPQFADSALRTAFSLGVSTGQLDDALRHLGQAEAPADHAQSDALILASLAIQDLLHAVDTSLASAARLTASDTTLQAAASASAMQALADAVKAAAASGHALDMDHPDTVSQVMHAAAASFGEAAGTTPDLAPYVANVATQMTRAQESYQQTLSANGDADMLAADNAAAAQSLDTAIDVVTNPPVTPEPPEPPAPPVIPDPPPIPPTVPTPLVLTLAEWIALATPPMQSFRIVDDPLIIQGATVQALAELAGDPLFTGISAGGKNLTLNLAQFDAITDTCLDAQDTVLLRDTGQNLESFFNAQGTPSPYASISKIDAIRTSDVNFMNLNYAAGMDSSFLNKLDKNYALRIDLLDTAAPFSDEKLNLLTNTQTVANVDFVGNGTITKTQFDLLSSKIIFAAHLTVDVGAWLKYGEVTPTDDQLVSMLTWLGVDHLSSFDMVINLDFIQKMDKATFDMPYADWMQKPDSTTLRDSGDTISTMLLGGFKESPAANFVDHFTTIDPQTDFISTNAVLMNGRLEKFNMSDSFKILLDLNSPFNIDNFTGKLFSVENAITVNGKNLTLQSSTYSGGLVLTTNGDSPQEIKGSQNADIFNLGGSEVDLRGGSGADSINIQPGVIASLHLESNATLNGKDTISGFALGEHGSSGSFNRLFLSDFVNNTQLYATTLDANTAANIDVSAGNVFTVSLPTGIGSVDGIFGIIDKIAMLPDHFVVIEGRDAQTSDAGTALTRALWFVDRTLGDSAVLEATDIQQVADLQSGMLSAWRSENFLLFI